MSINQGAKHEGKKNMTALWEQSMDVRVAKCLLDVAYRSDVHHEMKWCASVMFMCASCLGHVAFVSSDMKQTDC